MGPGIDHPHVHGANVGVRLSAYLRAGGFLAALTGEDHDLWHRLRATSATIVADSTVRVTTSARIKSRVEYGFARGLAELQNN